MDLKGLYPPRYRNLPILPAISLEIERNCSQQIADSFDLSYIPISQLSKSQKEMFTTKGQDIMRSEAYKLIIESLQRDFPNLGNAISSTRSQLVHILQVVYLLQLQGRFHLFILLLIFLQMKLTHLQ
jgi:hypothetical protein